MLHFILRFTAENVAQMRRYRFTHVLNCAHDKRRDNTIYDGMGITYMGLATSDQPSYDMSVHFKTAAEFIHSGLEGGGKQFSFIYLSNTAKHLCDSD